ncbi:sensor histidine kinase [Marinospirillum alkaliphilum]|uniref:histidine kinase n=1 Tax=Marinospirillum alkaliphilum DSM 21637 TaxID=1122209 RepID=A0A1K1X2I2_9GAMM|nr:ATP-binding protein [Marinospirillum alkaliphilum]SFX43864.1 Histidine kinase-, DNA gyrase B-, and HSP90-like ATPase [Marinospirillum alkaliphilum DSM 21637]
MRSLTIRTRLLLLTLGVSFGTLLVAALLIDRHLLGYHRDLAQQEITEGFARLESQLQQFQARLELEAGVLASNERLVASVDLINAYQNPEQYQAILFDEEKRSISQRLLTALLSGQAQQAFVYSLQQELVSLVAVGDQHNLQVITSYVDAQPLLLVLQGDPQDFFWPEQSLETSLQQRAQSHDVLDQQSALSPMQGGLLLEHGRTLWRSLPDGRRLPVGQLVLSRWLDDDYLSRLLPDHLTFHLLEARAAGVKPGVIQQDSEGFYALQQLMSSHNQPIFLQLRYPLHLYEASRKTTRRAIWLAVPLTFLLVLPLALWLLFRLITHPLGNLMQGVERLRAGNYEQLVPIRSGDELGQLAQAMNQMAVEIRQREQDLHQVNQDLRRLSEVMAHHFQEPVRRLQVFSEQLQQSEALTGDEKNRLALTFIQQQSRRLSQLVRDVQQYLALEQVQPEFEWLDSRVELTRLLTSSPLRSRLDAAGARVLLGENLPQVWFSTKRFQQLFAILLDNALNYASPQRPLEVHIDAHKEAQSWVFSVADNGSGIDPVYLQQVFDLFVRLVPSDYPVAGSGMGLALARRMLQLSGGDLRVRTNNKQVKGTQEQGCVFEVLIADRNRIDG